MTNTTRSPTIGDKFYFTRTLQIKAENQFNNRRNNSSKIKKLKSEIKNLTGKSHFDIKEKTRRKTDISHSRLGATKKTQKVEQ